MGLKLPRLTTNVDCAPIGYPGITVTFWLNAPNIDLEAAVADEYSGGDEPWMTAWYYGQARFFECINVPGDYTDSGEPEAIEITDAHDLWRLERRGDFDPQILLWSVNAFINERSKRLQTEAKN